jgi:hypothetical protein
MRQHLLLAQKPFDLLLAPGSVKFRNFCPELTGFSFSVEFDCGGIVN